MGKDKILSGEHIGEIQCYNYAKTVYKRSVVAKIVFVLAGIWS
ncbi:hypothetical protein C7475_108277 [Chitinophaga sp. S165]|nr:hypothetical protein C7475_108277 [Chitinophaga sp. S165]